MSYSIFCLFKGQAIFVYDHRIIEWYKVETGEVIKKKVDSPGGKFFKINSLTYFIPPANGILGNLLTDFFRNEFGKAPINLKDLAKRYPTFQKKGEEIIREAHNLTRKSLEGASVTLEDLGEPFFNRPDCFLGGVDSLGRPFLLDIREDFKCQLHGPPAIIGFKHDPWIDKIVGRKMRKFAWWTNNQIFDWLPTIFSKKFQRWYAAILFPKIIKFVAKRDFRVSSECDVFAIDQKGSYRLRKKCGGRVCSRNHESDQRI